MLGHILLALSEASAFMKSVFRLIRMIGFGFMSYFMLLRLIIFCLIIWPAVLPVALWFWSSKQVLRGLRYGDKARNYLDIYLPKLDSGSIAPVMIGVTGGAWIVGYKAWLANVGKRISEGGCIFISVDYRNFPQGCLPEMLEDVSKALDWIIPSVRSLGGDPDRVQLLGQSAGAHILALLLIQNPGRWNVQKFFALSGPFDLVKLFPRLNARGLNAKMLSAILGGDVFGASPIRRLSGPIRLPPVRLYHGTRDATVPMASSLEFSKALVARGVDCTVTLLDGMTHSEPLLEGPLRDKHIFADLILRELELSRPPAIASSSTGSLQIALINLAQSIMPF